MDELLADEAAPDMAADLAKSLKTLERDVERLELATLLGGEYDGNDAVATLHAGAGGTESQDWAEMLMRMYLRWAEREKLPVEVDDMQYGDEAGIKSTTFIVHGTNAYGLLSAERGVHRLVRISPFDAQKRRHTSFANLDVIPLIEETDAEFEIDPKDLRIDVFRSTGPGGQSVNTTDSAVRITHLPTGLVAACQNERSQLQNRERAMQMLKAKLLVLAQQEQAAQLDEIRGENVEAGWGRQIRSYVLQPYQMVKDLRSDVELGNVEAILNGEIDPLVEGYLRWRRAEHEKRNSSAG